MMKLKMHPRQANTKRMLCNDVRRELRWSYKDQSIRNIVELVGKIQRFSEENKSYMAQRTSVALNQYARVLNKYRNQKCLIDEIKLSSIALLNLIRDWELSTETHR